MRLKPRNAAAERQARSDRLRRDRAAALTLRAAFPTLQQLRLELKFQGNEAKGANVPTPQSHVLHPPARAFFVYPCPYADCEGQFDLTEAVNSALAEPSHQAIGSIECRGVRAHEAISKHPCLLHLVYTVVAGYEITG